jgi:hypothetical protein
LSAAKRASIRATPCDSGSKSRRSGSDDRRDRLRAIFAIPKSATAICRSSDRVGALGASFHALRSAASASLRRYKNRLFCAVS